MMPKDPKLYDALNTQTGREHHCPKCGGHNPSGKKLPDECVWCNMFAELPKADLSKGWTTPQQGLISRLNELFAEADSIIESHPELVQDIDQEQFERIEKLVEGVEIDDISTRLRKERDAYKKSDRDMAETVDNVRTALGLESTHYLIIADQVAEVVEEKARLERENAELAAKWYEKGRESAMRDNRSGCCCKIDENDKIVELCKAHRDYILQMELEQAGMRDEIPAEGGE